MHAEDTDTGIKILPFAASRKITGDISKGALRAFTLVLSGYCIVRYWLTYNSRAMMQDDTDLLAT